MLMVISALLLRFTHGECSRQGGMQDFSRVSSGLPWPRRAGRIKNPERNHCGGLLASVRPSAIPTVMTTCDRAFSARWQGRVGLAG